MTSIGISNKEAPIRAFGYQVSNFLFQLGYLWEASIAAYHHRSRQVNYCIAKPGFDAKNSKPLMTLLSMQLTKEECVVIILNSYLIEVNEVDMITKLQFSSIGQGFQQQWYLQQHLL